jgi:hypothetical protein
MLVGGQTTQKEKIDIPSVVRTVLKEQEKEFDHLICKLNEVMEQLREKPEIVGRIERAKEKLETFRDEISSILKCRFSEM